MVRMAKDLYNRPICAVDGEIGKLHDFYFDDRSWRIRYLVVESRKWFNSRRVLFSPLAITASDGDCLRIKSTKAEITKLQGNEMDKSPYLHTRENAELLYAAALPAGGLGTGVGAVFFPSATGMESAQDDGWDQHLRSSRAISRYPLCTEDGFSGKAMDILFDDRFWIIRFLLIKPDDACGAETRLLDTDLVTYQDWPITILQTKCRGIHLLQCPAFDRKRHVNVSYEHFITFHIDSLHQRAGEPKAE